MEENQEEKKEETEKQEDENIKALEFIWQNVNMANSRTGAFSLEDCEQVLNSYKLLTSFLNAISVSNKGKEEGNEPATAGKIIFNAYDVILTAVQIQNAKGIFTLEGAAELLKNLRLLKANLDKIKDPALELEALKSKSKIVKDKVDKKKNKKSV